MIFSTDALFYVDFAYGHVRIYDLHGNLISVVGKRGEGPGKFTGVYHVDVVETGEVPQAQDRCVSEGWINLGGV